MQVKLVRFMRTKGEERDCDFEPSPQWSVVTTKKAIRYFDATGYIVAEVEL